MLTAAFPKLENLKCTRFLRAFFRSAYYPFLVAALMAVSELFALELPVYYIYLFFGVLCILFCEDTLGVLPIACCGYMTFSPQNNPGRFPDTTAFADPKVLLSLVIVLIIAGIVLLGRLVQCILLGRRGTPRLTTGFLALGVAYILAGAFSGYYALNTVFYGFVQILALAFFYFYFFFTVDWEKADKRYIFFIMTAVAAGLFAEIVGMYFQSGILTAEYPDRTMLYTGWGIYNNVGGMMAMCMPAPFYFSLKVRKNGWLFSLLACVYMLGVILTQSRSAIVCGGVIFCVAAAIVLFKTRGKERIINAALFGVFIAALTVAVILLRNNVSSLFTSLFSIDMNDNGRFGIYKNCLKIFREYPIFGKGFYRTPGAVMTNDGEMHFVFPDTASDLGFIPARAHNTIMQLLASGGIFALAAYLFHRVQTVILLFRNPTAEKTVISLCIAALLLASLLDCHFFNLGPGLLYGCLLVSAEGSDKAQMP